MAEHGKQDGRDRVEYTVKDVVDAHLNGDVRALKQILDRVRETILEDADPESDTAKDLQNFPPPRPWGSWRNYNDGLGDPLHDVRPQLGKDEEVEKELEVERTRYETEDDGIDEWIESKIRDHENYWEILNAGVKMEWK